MASFKIPKLNTVYWSYSRYWQNRYTDRAVTGGVADRAAADQGSLTVRIHRDDDGHSVMASQDVHDSHPPVIDDVQCDGQFDDTCLDMNDVTSEYDDNEEAEIDQLEQALQERNNRELQVSI